VVANRSSAGPADGSAWSAIALSAAFVIRFLRSTATLMSDARSATLSAGRTSCSQTTGRPPASSSQSSENVRIRSISRLAMRNRTTMRSAPSSFTGPAGAPDAVCPVGGEVALDPGSIRHDPQHGASPDDIVPEK
jgi:hypothetical protein